MKMRSCMQEANGDQDKKAACKQMAKEAVNSTGLDPKGSKGTVERELKKAAQMEATDVIQNCGDDKAVCQQELLERVAGVRGVSVNDVSEYELKHLLQEGAIKAAKESLLACKAAKKDNSQATCEDL